MELAEYIELIIDPTFADFHRNPRSGRHAFLACVATFHAVDRAAYPRKPGNLRKQWQQQSLEFLIVDMIAYHFKHIQRDHEKQPLPDDAIPLTSIVFGQDKGGREALGLDLHNLYFIIRDAIRFIRDSVTNSSSEAEARPSLNKLRS